MSALSFFGRSQEEQEAARDAERERHQQFVLDELICENPGKLESLRERPWQAGWFVGRMIIQMGKDADIMDAWSYVLRAAFASHERQEHT